MKGGGLQVCVPAIVFKSFFLTTQWWVRSGNENLRTIITLGYLRQISIAQSSIRPKNTVILFTQLAFNHIRNISVIMMAYHPVSLGITSINGPFRSLFKESINPHQI